LISPWLCGEVSQLAKSKPKILSHHKWLTAVPQGEAWLLLLMIFDTPSDIKKLKYVRCAV
jgi:hypothetical protein